MRQELERRLHLQEEIDVKLDDLLSSFRRVIEENRKVRGDHRIIVELGGDLYELGPANETFQAIDSCRKHNGFFRKYRLSKLGKAITGESAA
jgi:hemin uptake protein HemP